MRIMKKNRRFMKITAAVLPAVMLAGAVCTPLQAKAPKVEIDESMYVNMDYYGAIDDISVVKGCFLNGNTVIEDYGEYDEIINMSDRTQPVVDNGKVTWNLQDTEKQYFYYECKSEDLKKKVPWDIDVSYRLNGVEAAGEDLGGAQGLVTTLIHVTPKEDIPDYYKNNMILMCGTIVDMKDTLSIEAPGAQLQTLGTEKAAIFLALPGEESEFRVDIGTNKYESMGVFFMIVPATLDSLEIVNDVREVRDTVEDSVDAMDDALDVILDNIDGMRDDLASVEEGLKKAEEAHQIYDKNRESMEADADAAIASLENMVTYLEIINTQTQADQDNLDQTINRLADMMYTIGNLSSFGSDMSANLSNLNGSLGMLNEIADGTIDQEKIEQLQGIAGASGMTQTGAVTVEDVAKKAVMEKAAEPVKNGVINVFAERTGISGDQLRKVYETYQKNPDQLNDEQKALAGQMSTAINAKMQETIAKELPGAIREMGYDPDTERKVQLSNPSGADIGLKTFLTTYIETLEKLNVDAGDTGKALISNSQELLQKANSVMDTVDSMAKWTDETVREDVQTLITQLTDLISATEMTLSATQAALSSIRTTMELTEDTLSSSLTLTLNGLTGVMHSGVGIADGVDIMRDAKNTVKDAVDNELDEIEEEHNFLNLDVTESFPSFTSEKNESPNSIQIIMRTAEITADDDADNVTDIEVPREDIGMWGRFKAVFVNLWNKILGIFQ